MGEETTRSAEAVKHDRRRVETQPTEFLRVPRMVYETPVPEAPAMKLPRMRFTVGRLMIGVAIVAVALGLCVWARRMVQLSRAYQRKAVYHALQEEKAKGAPIRHHDYDELISLRASAAHSGREAEEQRRKQAEAQHALDAKLATNQPTTQSERREPWYWGVRADEAEWAQREALSHIAFYESRVAYHVRMQQRYERATTRPWEPVDFEPAPPEVYRPPDPLQHIQPPP